MLSDEITIDVLTAALTLMRRGSALSPLSAEALATLRTDLAHQEAGALDLASRVRVLALFRQGYSHGLQGDSAPPEAHPCYQGWRRGADCLDGFPCMSPDEMHDYCKHIGAYVCTEEG